MKKYIKSIEIPRFHKISFNHPYLKLSYEDLYLQGDIWNRKIPKPIQRIMDEIDLKNNKQDE